ncbi:DNA polymerase III subunit gamma/tau [Campylobacter sp. CNRCH_2013_0671h]|uniref:DNA polymerase III subunit gamma/tau n=1 Tax=unclassified Campylobacter TaxID=2593542 RepID=UPI001270F1DC|nr:MULTISPECIES: DNA polymerase III subunit gamma/tau [unclassified Campylobacter]EAJ5678451.1 DNA polymerase III subunit gamma/tau [Campylobacter lari]EAK0445066.1 DNA polymerase III subunit gamma/tau [Campylobacter lari]EAK9943720.1 DNA polymerase III subunit gamma/tau [Campylobacter lari]MCV3425228.1 DNA polymerase III subunit gamma/tau [Campylobacter sp. IFREMER_LSEM_CL1085]MCV3531193.1 DNA polymerase III subunit gamma/tau [Campylobacter sp. CNRCH_2007_0968H]
MLQALAVKYRPKNFNELVGQNTVSTSLKYALENNRLAHAYLFSGLRGSGKTSSARIFSRALVCEKGPSANPCGECSQCLSSLSGSNIDIIEMDAASHRSLEDIQELIEQVKYAPSLARFKIFIIDEVHMLTPQAANALLKTLEEPPSYVKFILATTDPLKLPATVLSRTQHFRFKQISIHDILNHLEWILEKENINYEKEALKLIARSGNGSLRDTLTLLDQAIVYCQNHIQTQKITAMLGFLDPSKIEEFYQAILASDKDKVLEFLKEFEDYEASNVIDEMIFFLKEAFFAKNNLFSMLIYERFFRILSRAKTMLNSSDDDSFVLCVMAFMLIEATYLKSIDEAIYSKSPKQDNTPNPKQQEILSIQTIKEEKLNPYESLLKAIYKRDYDLAEVFKKTTQFISFEDDILSISSHAKDDDRKILNNGFKLIKVLLHELFGEKTQIKIQKIETIDTQKLQDIFKTPIKQEIKSTPNLNEHFENFKKDAKKYDPKDETKEALNKLFGSPTIQN